MSFESDSQSQGSHSFTEELEATYISSSRAGGGRLVHFFLISAAALLRVSPSWLPSRSRVVVVADAVTFDAAASQQLVAQRVFDVSRCTALRMPHQDAVSFVVAGRAGGTGSPPVVSVLDTLAEQLSFVDLIRSISAVFRAEHASTEPCTYVFSASSASALCTVPHPVSQSSLTVFVVELDGTAFSSSLAEQSQAVAELRRRAQQIEELRARHTMEVARLREEMRAEKEASLLEMVRLHAEREKLMESVALLEYGLSTQPQQQHAKDRRFDDGTLSESSEYREHRVRMEVSTLSGRQTLSDKASEKRRWPS
jgi:hypothetical protein